MSDLGININYNIPETVENIMNNKYLYVRLNQLNLNKKAEQVQLSAYGSLKNLLSNFQTQTTNLAKAFKTVTFEASSSNTSIVSSATLSSNEVGAGTHTVIVDHIAAAQRQTSDVAYTSKTTQLGFAQTLTFTNIATPTKNFSVQVSATDTLEEVRDNINSASTELGIKASLVSFTDAGIQKFKVVLTAEEGLTNRFTVSGDTGHYFDFSESQAAADAVFTFDGLDQVRGSNVIDDVLDGLKFTLQSAGTATITTVNGEKNIQDIVKTAVQDTLTAYNQIVTFIDANKRVGVYDDEHKLMAKNYNDAFGLIKSQLNSAVMITDYAGIGTLNSLGITYSATQLVKGQYDRFDKGHDDIASHGSLEINAKPNAMYDNGSKFEWMVNNKLEDLETFFTESGTGFIDKVNDLITNKITKSDQYGVIQGATKAIDQKMIDTDKQIEMEKKRLDMTRDRMFMQFALLNQIISKYQSQSDYLTKQFEYLAKSGK